MGTKTPYYVYEFGGKACYVEARNGHTVAKCTSVRMARRIARLLNADAAAKAPSSPEGTKPDA